MINRKFFFDHVRCHLFDGKLRQSHVDGFNAILAEWERKYAKKDDRWLAYMLATTHHETDRTMQPIEEYGKGKGRTYGVADSVTGHTYYGRGFVQLTWKSNYQSMGKKLKVDLVNRESDASVSARNPGRETNRGRGTSQSRLSSKSGRNREDRRGSLTSRPSNTSTVRLFGSMSQQTSIPAWRYCRHFWRSSVIVWSAVNAPRQRASAMCRRRRAAPRRPVRNVGDAVVREFPHLGSALGAGHPTAPAAVKHEFSDQFAGQSQMVEVSHGFL